MPIEKDREQYFGESSCCGADMLGFAVMLCVIEQRMISNAMICYVPLPISIDLELMAFLTISYTSCGLLVAGTFSTLS